MGNVELFELFETIPKVQCKECLLYWNQLIVYCTCGHLLRQNEIQPTSSPMAIGCSLNPNYVIKKGRPHGARHGKLQHRRSTSKHINARKRCIKKGCKGIRDLFQKDLRYRDAQLKADRLRRSASRWTSWHKQILPISPSTEELRKPGQSL